MVSTQTAPRLSSFHFLFFNFIMIFIEAEGRKNHEQIFSASVFLCVLALGMDTEGTAARLQGCFISLTRCKPHKHTVGANDVEEAAEEEWRRRLVQSVGGFRYLSRCSASLGESQCTA